MVYFANNWKNILTFNTYLNYELFGFVRLWLKQFLV